MSSNTEYRIQRLCISKENPNTNFSLINKISNIDDNDYNILLTMSNEIYIKEFNKILKINNINSVSYDYENKKQNYDNKIEYTIKEIDENEVKISDEVSEHISEINNIVNNLVSHINIMKNKISEKYGDVFESDVV